MTRARKIILWFIRVDLLLIILITLYALLNQNLGFLWVAAALLAVLLLVMAVNAWVLRIKWLREKLQKASSNPPESR